MSSVAEVATVMREHIDDGVYSIDAVFIEIAVKKVMSPEDEQKTVRALDPDAITRPYRKMTNWDDVLLLLAFWHLEGLVQSGHFQS